MLLTHAAEEGCRTSPSRDKLPNFPHRHQTLDALIIFKEALRRALHRPLALDDVEGVVIVREGVEASV